MLRDLPDRLLSEGTSWFTAREAADAAGVPLAHVYPGLKRLADRAGLSVSAYAVRELAVVARRSENPALLADLPDLGVDPDSVVSALEAGRAER